MGAEHNDLVSADEARRLLDGIVPGPWRTERPIPLSRTIVADFDGEVVAIASIALTSPGTERANTRLVAAAPDLARTVIAREAEVAELRAEINRLHDALRATARACTLPEDTTPEALPAQVEACLRDLSGQIERLTTVATNTVPPTREEVERHVQEHGGFWMVSRVRCGAEWRPMVLLVSSDARWLRASIPGVDFGAMWDDDPFRLMAGATWTPLTREGRRLHRTAPLRADLQHNDDTEDDCEFDHV